MRDCSAARHDDAGSERLWLRRRARELSKLAVVRRRPSSPVAQHRSHCLAPGRSSCTALRRERNGSHHCNCGGNVAVCAAGSLELRSKSPPRVDEHLAGRGKQRRLHSPLVVRTQSCNVSQLFLLKGGERDRSAALRSSARGSCGAQSSSNANRRCESQLVRSGRCIEHRLDSTARLGRCSLDCNSQRCRQHSKTPEDSANPRKSSRTCSQHRWRRPRGHSHEPCDGLGSRNTQLLQHRVSRASGVRHTASSSVGRRNLRSVARGSSELELCRRREDRIVGSALREARLAAAGERIVQSCYSAIASTGRHKQRATRLR